MEQPSAGTHIVSGASGPIPCLCSVDLCVCGRYVSVSCTCCVGFCAHEYTVNDNTGRRTAASPRTRIVHSYSPAGAGLCVCVSVGAEQSRRGRLRAGVELSAADAGLQRQQRRRPVSQLSISAGVLHAETSQPQRDVRCHCHCQ